MEQKKTTIWHALICVVLVCLIWGGYFVVRSKMEEVKEERSIRELEIELDYDMLSQIEQVSANDGELIIEGWALRINSKNRNTYIVLKSNEKGEDFVIQTNCTERADIDSIVEDGYDFGKTGFSAKLKESELRSDVSYEILIVLDYEGEENQVQQKKITTNRYLYDGELYRYRPEEFVKPEIEEESIKEVIDKGVLYGYDIEKGGWIYGYQGMLYWILDAKQFQDVKTSACIPVRIFTTQGDRIPVEREEEYKKKGYDYFEIFLKEKYEVDSGKMKYYVVSMELPEYLITYVRTGSYGNDGVGWLYKEEFQMDFIK